MSHPVMSGADSSKHRPCRSPDDCGTAGLARNLFRQSARTLAALISTRTGESDAPRLKSPRSQPTNLLEPGTSTPLPIMKVPDSVRVFVTLAILLSSAYAQRLSRIYQQDGGCSASSPCEHGCCGQFGHCGYGPEFCEDGCQGTCDAVAECGRTILTSILCLGRLADITM